MERDKERIRGTMGEKEKQEQYEEYIKDPGRMAAIGRRVPYHLEYLRRYRNIMPAPVGLGKGEKEKKP